MLLCMASKDNKLVARYASGNRNSFHFSRVERLSLLEATCAWCFQEYCAPNWQLFASIRWEETNSGGMFSPNGCPKYMFVLV